MGISGLKDWLQEALKINQNPTPPWLPAPTPRKQPTIQPNVPLPTYREGPNGSYSVQNLPPGTSVFRQFEGVGVLKNPRPGLVFFDPTGQARDGSSARPGQYLAVPMAPTEFKPMPYLQRIGY